MHFSFTTSYIYSYIHVQIFNVFCVYLKYDMFVHVHCTYTVYIYYIYMYKFEVYIK